MYFEANTVNISGPKTCVFVGICKENQSYFMVNWDPFSP